MEAHMVTKLKQMDNYFPHFLLLFIVFQPILDLLTSFSIYVLHMSAIGLVNNLMVKSPVSFGEEVKFILKSVYPIVLLFGYIIALKELKKNEYVFHKIITYFLNACQYISITFFQDKFVL